MTNRKYVSENLEIKSWKSVEKYYNDLKIREIKSLEDLKKWLRDRSELDAVMSEDLAWRYIKMSCNTEDKLLSDSYDKFVSEIQPEVEKYDFELDKMLYSNPFAKQLDGEDYRIMLRSVNNSIDLFREENIPIKAQLAQEEQEYGKITGAMTVQHKGEELTLQQANALLQENDRQLRATIHNAIWTRRLKDKEQLNSLIIKLIEKRQLLAKNANFDNYRDYKFRSLGRFDYSVDDCYNFHEVVKSTVVPLVEKLHENRKQNLNLEHLKPWDLQVDENSKSAIRAFANADELVEKTIKCFNKVKPEYGDFLRIMQQRNYLDLESRKGKAPGGFNYPLYESNIPFIFMNSSGTVRDIETMVHEGGHAIHAFLCKDLELVDFKETPSEVAELASMSMELISMEHWDSFFTDKEELIRAKREQIQGLVHTLAWVAHVDKFQHLLYLENDISSKKIVELWQNTAKDFMSSVVDWSDAGEVYDNFWQKQLHIFEVPFYYIEYGFAQLGAIAIWRNYKKNPEKALTDYENALKLGYTKTIPEIYKTAGIDFNFSKQYVTELMNFVEQELEKLRIEN